MDNSACYIGILLCIFTLTGPSLCMENCQDSSLENILKFFQMKDVL